MGLGSLLGTAKPRGSGSGGLGSGLGLADSFLRPNSRSRGRPSSSGSTSSGGSDAATGAAMLTSSGGGGGSSSDTPEYIADEEQIAAPAEETPDLRELNNSLEALAVVFPDVQVDVFREMLSSFEGESRLALVADALLKNRVAWVKGRWRVERGGGGGGAERGAAERGGAERGGAAAKAGTGKGAEKGAAKGGTGKGAEKGAATEKADAAATPEAAAAAATEKEAVATPPTLHPADRFRNPEYMKAARALACHEFMGLSRSTILAVLAEQNYAYLEARRVLVHLSSKSWRFTISSLFLRRKPVTSAEAENHPLIVWKSSGRGSIVPTIRATGSAELDRELFAALIVPLRAQLREVQEDGDRALAGVLNTAEAEAAGATFDCACCFATVSFEELVMCRGGEEAGQTEEAEQKGDGARDGAGTDADAPTGPPHLVCFRCVQHSVREAVFGQGWARTISPEHGTMRCPAVDTRECSGMVPVDLLRRALLAEKRGADTLQHLERRLAEHSLVASGLPLVRCPFCEYAEVDDVYVQPHEARLRLRLDSLYSLVLVLLVLGATPLLFVPLLAVAMLGGLFPGGVPLGGGWWLSFPSGERGGSRGSRGSDGGSHATASLRWELAAAVARFRRRRRGKQFRCRRAACGRLSCLACGKAWVDVHVCHESSLVALRTQVEQAMSMAIKRVCPRCHTSFVKTAGCNKLTCPCGYNMCYVCRKDISGHAGPDAGYRHFCDHFRPHGDGRPCTQCRKCNLWEKEDTEAVLAAARDDAERKWRETERRELSGAERAFLETGIAVQSAASARRLLGRVWGGLAAAGGGGSKGGEAGSEAEGLHLPTLAEVLDWLLESILV